MAVEEPLSRDRARDLIRAILGSGTVVVSEHAEAELDEAGLCVDDALDLLAHAPVKTPRFEHGSWRYRVTDGDCCVVVAFASATWLIVVTGWRC